MDASCMRQFKERTKRRICKPLSRRLQLPLTKMKTDIASLERNSCFRYSLYVITLVLLGVTVWTIYQPTSPDAVMLTLSSDKMVQAVYKCAYENADGTVDLVFNIPQGGEELLRLNDLHVNASDVISGRAPGTAQEDTKDGNNVTVTQLPGKPSVKTAYPISLDADYVINTVNLCPPGQPVDYLIVVHSATAYFARRQTIRETYGGERLFGSIVQRVVFLLGRTIDPATTKAIQEEALMHRDIVQGRFIDSYHNLTHKGVLGYRWVAEFCPQARLIVKIDDDVFLNPFKLVREFYPEYKNKSRHIACHLRPGGTSPITRGKGKWQVKDDEFKGQTHYPFDYCNGYFVIITSDLIRPLLNAARVNPFFWIDDVYLFGILPATVGKTKFVNIAKYLTLSYTKGVSCFETEGRDCHFLGVSQWPPKEPEKLWYMLLSNLTIADKEEFQLFGIKR